MMSKLSNNFKACVTCDYFDGCRKPIGYLVEYNQSEKGKCYKNFMRGIDKHPLSACGDWTVWGAIKTR